MKLAKRKVTPFQAIKLTCASESEVQTLKTTVFQHEEDSKTGRFFQCHAEKFDFLPTRIAVCSVRCVYLEKTLCYSLAQMRMFRKNSLLQSNACAGESAVGKCCIVNIISGFFRLISGSSVIM